MTPSSPSTRFIIARAAARAPRAYLAHPVLRPRLRQCCEILLGLEGVTAEQVFGPVDTLKLRSCMELFDAVEPGAVFAAVLGKWFGER